MRIVYRLLFVLLISMYLLGCGAKTSSIEGKFVDGTGKPLSGISVIFKQVQPTQGYEQFETKTGADGVFRFAGCAPASEYIISPLSDKWKSKVTKKVKTLQAGQNLVLTQPIKIRFTQLKDGSVTDTKTGLQWKIYPVKDVTAANILEKVKSLNEGGFTDWRLPSRADLASLLEEKAVPKNLPESTPVIKTCCAWVSEPNTQDVDWKFYVEEDNELWSSNKETPDNRIIIVRNMSGAPAVAVAQPVAKQTAAAPVVSPAPAVAPANIPAPTVLPQLPGQTPSKAPGAVRYASRKACAEKKAKAAKTEQTNTAEKPAPAPVAAAPKVLPAAPKTVTPAVTSPAPASTTQPKATTTTTTPKAASPSPTPASKAAVPASTALAPKASSPSVSVPKTDSAKIIDKEPAKKADATKVVPTQSTASVKKSSPVKKQEIVRKSEPVKAQDQDVSAEKGLTLYFESGSSKIPTKELVKLKTFFSKIKNNKGTIVVNGHSDASSNGEATGNVMLSNERSSNVLQALHKMGLSRQIKLEMGALGDSKPAASNDTPEGRKLNRRVEINFMPE